MKKTYGLILILAFLKLQYLCAQTVTWADDIACITYTHCAGCHNNQSSLAAFPLTSYQEAYAQRNAMKYYSTYLSMPPYQPNTRHRRYVNEKNMTQQEIGLIASWVNSGCPRGDTANEPPFPVFNSIKSTILSPDVSLKMQDYIIPYNGVNFRRCFILSPPLSSSKLIKQIEVIPGDLSAIYAVYVYADTSSIPTLLDSAGSGYMNFGGTGSNSAKPLYGFVHGTNPLNLPGNCALKIDSGSRYIIQVEYAEDAGGKLDSTRLNIKYTRGVGNRAIEIGALLHHDKDLINGPFIVQPDSVIEFHEFKTLSSDITLFSVSPNLHHICTDFKVFAIQPGNDTVQILEVEDHGEIWSEGTYFSQNPVYLKKGTELHAIANYDNTLSNGNNPNNPPLTISPGFGETDEQMVFNFSYAPYITGDENIILDSFPHPKHYENCTPKHKVSSIPPCLSKGNKIIVYPNPATTTLCINLPDSCLSAKLTLINMVGETVLSQDISNNANPNINISNIDDGIYIIRLKTNDIIITNKFIKR